MYLLGSFNGAYDLNIIGDTSLFCSTKDLMWINSMAWSWCVALFFNCAYKRHQRGAPRRRRRPRPQCRPRLCIGCSRVGGGIEVLRCWMRSALSVASRSAHTSYLATCVRVRDDSCATHLRFFQRLNAISMQCHTKIWAATIVKLNLNEHYFETSFTLQ